MPKLILSGVTYELVDEAITIGRGPDNTIVVNDPSISTHHAQLLLEGDTYRLKDLDSTNGTRVNGKPVTETVLRFDDRIRFGAAEARYESSEASGSKPLPKPEEIKAQFAANSATQPHFTNASPFRRPEQQNDPVRMGIFVGLGIVLLVFFGSMIAVLMMHAPSL
jgi:pSer/pThr/pTyr-binding forkhead associated (FHA) protein